MPRMPNVTRTSANVKLSGVDSAHVQRVKWQSGNEPSTHGYEENYFEDDEDLFRIVHQDKSRLISGLQEQLQINEETGADDGPHEPSLFSFLEGDNERGEHMSNEVVAEEFLSAYPLDENTSNDSATKLIDSYHRSLVSSAGGAGIEAGIDTVSGGGSGSGSGSGKQEEVTFSDNYSLTTSLVSTRLKLVKLVHKIAKLSCYTGLGEHYHGNVSISDDLRPCFNWLLFRHSNHLINSSLTKLHDDKNHCRNPNLSPRGPWCFVKYIEQLDGLRAIGSPRSPPMASVSQQGIRFVGRPCALSPCSRYLWLYIVAPPLSLLLIISCLMMLIVRSIRKARYSTVFAANSDQRQLSKLHQFLFVGDRYSAKRLFATYGDKKKSDKFSDEDTFEIVDDLDWSDGQTQSFSPKSCQSLKPDSSFSRSSASPNANCDSQKNACDPSKTVLSARALHQFHQDSDLIHSRDTSFNEDRLVTPMFATLRCLVRNKTNNTHNSGYIATSNQVNMNNKYNISADDQSASRLKNEPRDELSLRTIEPSSPESFSSTPSDPRIIHKLSSGSHLISYSNTINDINSMDVNLPKVFRICDLPKLNSSKISTATDQQPIFEGVFNQVVYGFLNNMQTQCNINENIGSQVAISFLKANAVTNDFADLDMSKVKLNHLNHLNLVKLIGFYEKSNEITHSKLSIHLVYDMSHLVDLSDWLNQQSQCTLTCEEPGHEPELRRNLSCLTKQIALAIDYLHDLDIIFKDLACRNCFLDPTKMLIKLASFNIDLILTEEDEKTQSLKSMVRPKYLLDYYVIDTRPSNSQLLPLSWVPLETILFNKFNKQTDVWSLGCLIYELFSLGEVAFFGYSSKQIIDSVRSNAMPPQPLLCPNGIYKLMCRCLSDIPSMRPDIKQIYEHLNLYSGQCSSFLDHHLCSLDTSVLSRPMKDLKAGSNQSMKSIHNSITKTKSQANLKCQSIQETINSSSNYDTPLPLSSSTRPEMVRLPFSKSTNLSTNRPSCVRSGTGKQTFLDVNQYDEPLVAGPMEKNI